MLARRIEDRIYWMGSVDWDARLFDSLIPLPDGTSYNAYLVEGSEKTALLDSVDPPKADELLSQRRGSLKSITSSHTMRNRTTPEPFHRFSRNIRTPS